MPTDQPKDLSTLLAECEAAHTVVGPVFTAGPYPYAGIYQGTEQSSVDPDLAEHRTCIARGTRQCVQNTKEDREIEGIVTLVNAFPALRDEIERLQQERGYWKSVALHMQKMDGATAAAWMLERGKIISALGIREDIDCGRDLVDAAQSMHTTYVTALDESAKLATERDEAQAQLAQRTEALRWMWEIIDTMASTPVPFEAVGGPTEMEWHCWGCRGRFKSCWPEWPHPTDSTFPHASDCKYMMARRALAEPGEPDAH